MPYETRGKGQGPGTERFGHKSWIRLDACRDRLPFEDKSFEVAVSSHTLEDIRDPLFLCAEVNRVTKAGYIETPSIVAELTFRINRSGTQVRYHHRWLVAMQENDDAFRHKPHLVHGNWRYHLPKRVALSVTKEERVAWMLWQDSFSFSGHIELDKGSVEGEPERFVRRTCRPDWRCLLTPLEDAAHHTRALAGAKTRSLVSRAHMMRPPQSGS